jgi:EAL domain-containing protein (putative c-di-GMP-specific phosphodiesterase class I)
LPLHANALVRLPRNTLVALLAFGLTLALSMLALGSMNQRFAQRQLEAQGQTLLQGFQQGLAQARSELSQLPPLERLDCRDGLSLHLAQRTFDDGALRWLAVERDGQLLCRSHVVGIPWAEQAGAQAQWHQLDGPWSLRSLRDPNQRDSLFLVLARDGLRYIAALEPPRLAYVGDFECLACRAFKLRVLGEPPLAFASPPLLGPDTLQHELEASQDGLSLALSLQAGPAFLEHYRLQGWLASSLLALTLSAGVGYLTLRLLLARNSLDFLIQEGLRQRAFVPFYQPIVDSRDGRLLGAEALVRWIGADGVIRPPSQFIPYAEDSGLILPITEQLTATVVLDIARFGWAGSERFVSINLVPEQLKDHRYGEQLVAAIAANGLKPCNVSVEITERRQFKDLANGRRVLGQLTEQGIEVKLDDAGTGFGGFSYVQELPIGTLKIDKMFIDTLLMGRDAKRPVLDAIVEFAKASGLQTIAEGVETTEQVQQLAAMGVFAIQGYVYGKPMSAEDFQRWMAAR